MKSARLLAAAAVRRAISPMVPDRKKLPFNYWVNRISGCGPELVRLKSIICKRGTAIDVGANQGLFTYVFSKEFERVYSFEANPEVAVPIRLYDAKNVNLLTCGLSSDARTAKFYVPRVGELTLTGWGSLNPGNLPGAEALIEKYVELKPLDDFEITGVDFIKIDVEGHEYEVLQGAAKTIERSRPVMLIELRVETLQPVNAWFRARKFQYWSLSEYFHLRTQDPNYIYIPEELLGQLGPAA